MINPTVWLYLNYLLISIILTVWVARTLHKHGRIFLVDAFGGNEPLADSVNHLLVVGFYLINIGYVVYAVKTEIPPVDVQQIIEMLSTKVGTVLLILGVVHFMNIFILSQMRKRAVEGQQPEFPPIPPATYVAPPFQG